VPLHPVKRPCLHAILDALEETLDVFADPVTMRRLRDGEAAVAAGEVVDEAGLQEMIIKRSR
jgi:hypothetical protein